MGYKKKLNPFFYFIISFIISTFVIFFTFKGKLPGHPELVSFMLLLPAILASAITIIRGQLIILEEINSNENNKHRTEETY